MTLIISVVVMVFVLSLTLPRSRRNIRDRLSQFRSEKEYKKKHNTENSSVLLLVKWARLTKKILRLSIAMNKKAKIREKLTYSGFGSKVTAEEFIYIKINLGVFCFFYFGFQYLRSPDFFNTFAFLFCSAAGYLIPEQWLNAKVRNRKLEMKRNVPYVLSLFAILTEAGLNITQALEEIGKNSKNALTLEIGKVSDDIRIGISPQVALEGFAQRVDVEEINYFVSSLMQGLDKGSRGVSEVVKMHARESWETRKALAKELAEKASMKLFLPLLLLVLPAMVIFLLGPMIFSMIDMFGSGI